MPDRKLASMGVGPDRQRFYSLIHSVKLEVTVGCRASATNIPAKGGFRLVRVDDFSASVGARQPITLWRTQRTTSLAYGLLMSPRQITDVRTNFLGGRVIKILLPDFAQQWVAHGTEGKDDKHAHRDDDTLSPSQQEALEALAQRVNAARSTI
jgi:hypothetical protein